MSHGSAPTTSEASGAARAHASLVLQRLPLIGECRSGGAAFVVMLHAADVGDFDNRARGGRLNAPRHRGVLVERQVGPEPVIVGDVLAEVATKRTLVPDDHMVEAFAPEGTDQAFDERIGVSRQLHRRGAVRPRPFESPIPFIRWADASSL